MMALTTTIRDDGIVVIEGDQFNAQISPAAHAMLQLLAEVLARDELSTKGVHGADVDAWFATLDDTHQGYIVLFEALVDAAVVSLRQRLANPLN